jgi:hypothetical protein
MTLSRYSENKIHILGIVNDNGKLSFTVQKKEVIPTPSNLERKSGSWMKILFHNNE